MSDDNLVFVYGTLMRGCSNARYLDGQRRLGEGRTSPGFELRRLAGYPGMIRSETDTAGVPGEVWAVDDACLLRLHRLEGLSEGLYEFVPITLQPPHEKLAVRTYLYLRSVDGAPRIPGRWTE